MSLPEHFEIVIFAAIAALVLFQLYNVLGKKVGRQPQEDAKDPAKAEAALAGPVGGSGQPAPAATGRIADPMTMAAAAPLKARDPAFDPVKFLEGARQAYETIVRGYAAGDRAVLKPLLTPQVLGSFEAGIAGRQNRGAETVEFVHSPRADLEATSVDGDRATAKVRFLAEIRNRITPAEGDEVIEERRTAEHWTFQRTLGSSDPNWVLSRVEPAEA